MLAFLFGFCGLVLLSFNIVSALLILNDITHFDRSEMTLFSYASTVWSIASIFGILGLWFHKEKKSPYFMLASAILGAGGFVYPSIKYGQNIGGSIPVSFWLLLGSTSCVLLVSTFSLLVSNSQTE